jgi:hypothetical protein
MFHFDIPRRVLSLVSQCEREDLVDKLVGLSLSPEYQSNHLRILTLLQVALVRATGKRRASCSNLASMLNGLRDHDAGRNEDPAEDVFVSGVSTPDGDFKIFNGIYTGADFSLQRVLDAVLSQDFPAHDLLAEGCRALLTLSNAIAQRCGFSANEYAPSQQWQDRWPVRLSPLIKRGRAVRFSPAELSELSVRREHLSPFLLEKVDGLLDAPYGYTALGRRPLLSDGTGVTIPIPSLISPALRLHFAHAVARRDAPRKVVADFHQLQLARWLLYDLPIRGARALRNEHLSVPEPEFELPGDYAHAVVQFDADKLAHLVLLEADWTNPPDRAIHQTRDASFEFEHGLASHLRHSFDALCSRQSLQRGLTLVVYDSPGWGLNFKLSRDLAPDWYVVGLSAYSLSMLLADPDFSLLDLWKMLREERRMAEMGVRLALWPDMLNYWSIWRTMHGTFWPRGIDLREFGLFSADTSRIQEQVANVRLLRSAHAARSPTGEWQRVERWIELDAPISQYNKPIYFDPIALVLGELRAVVENDRGSWWVASARPPFDAEDKRYLYLLWQSATEWILRLAQNSHGRLGDRQGALEIRLLPVPASIIDPPEHIEHARAPDLPVVTVVLPPRFFEDLATPDNRGEAALVRALAEAIVKAWDLKLSERELDGWVREVTCDPALKMMHITPSRDPGFAVDLVAEKVPFRLLQVPDLASASMRIRDALAAVPNIGVAQSTMRVEGPEAVKRVLNAAVDVRWLRCRDLLRQLDRAEFLVLVSRVIEAVQRHRVDTERSALARTRLYAESPDIDVWAKLTMGRRDAAFRSYRVAAEMAICEAPLTGGRMPGLSDVDAIAAEITFLIQAAEFSDAVRFGLVTPAFEFLPDGSLDPENGGAEKFMRDYLAACLGESIALDVDAYPQLYEESGRPRKEADEDDDDDEHGDAFLVAFQAELGLSLADAARTSAALQHFALEDQTDVVRLPRSILEQRLEASEFRVGRDMFGLFLSAFGLRNRPAWDGPPPPPYRQDDVWPWFFERRLSLMLRPAMIVSASSDPTIVYGIRQIEMGVRYASTLLEVGIWPKAKLLSGPAKAYVDSEANRRGEAFEGEIAELIEVTGWRVFRAMPMTRLGATRKLGDVDVLAISPDGKTWIVVECKWFGAARTPREIAGWMQDYRGHSEDKLDRHLQRHAWIEANRAAVAASLNITPPARALGRVVTTSPVPLAFTQDLPTSATVLTRRELISFLQLIESE